MTNNYAIEKNYQEKTLNDYVYLGTLALGSIIPIFHTTFNGTVLFGGTNWSAFKEGSSICVAGDVVKERHKEQGQ